MRAVYKGLSEWYTKWVTYGPVYFQHGQEYNIVIDHSYSQYHIVVNIIEDNRIIAKIPYHSNWTEIWETI